MLKFYIVVVILEEDKIKYLNAGSDLVLGKPLPIKKY